MDMNAAEHVLRESAHMMDGGRIFRRAAHSPPGHAFLCYTLRVSMLATSFGAKMQKKNLGAIENFGAIHQLRPPF